MIFQGFGFVCLWIENTNTIAIKRKKILMKMLFENYVWVEWIFVGTWFGILHYNDWLIVVECWLLILLLANVQLVERRESNCWGEIFSGLYLMMICLVNDGGDDDDVDNVDGIGVGPHRRVGCYCDNGHDRIDDVFVERRWWWWSNDLLNIK